MKTMNEGRLAFDGGLRAGLRIFAVRIVVLALAIVAFNVIGWGTLALWPTSAYVYAALAMGVVMWGALRTMTRLDSVRRHRRRRLRSVKVIDVRPYDTKPVPPPRDRRRPENAPLRELHNRLTVLDAEAKRLSDQLRDNGATKEQISTILMAFYGSGGRGDMSVETLVRDFRQRGVPTDGVAQLARSYRNLLVADDPDRHWVGARPEPS